MPREAEEIAALVMDLFPEDYESGDCIPAGTVTSMQSKEGLTDEELRAGLKYARDKQWIEDWANGGICLTDEGFDHNNG